jgi:F0F1-type ATP synthase assembly protein I
MFKAWTGSAVLLLTLLPLILFQFILSVKQPFKGPSVHIGWGSVQIPPLLHMMFQFWQMADPSTLKIEAVTSLKTLETAYSVLRHLKKWVSVLMHSVQVLSFRTVLVRWIVC